MPRVSLVQIGCEFFEIGAYRAFERTANSNDVKDPQIEVLLVELDETIRMSYWASDLKPIYGQGERSKAASRA